MQKITFSYEIPGSNGSKTVTQSAVVDETIGIRAGRDIYATARGTAKKIARENNPFAWLTIFLTVGDYQAEMRIDNGAWVTTEVV